MPSAGKAQSSDFWDWSQALSQVCCGITSVTLLCLNYGAIFAIAGSVGLLFIPGKRNRSAI
jgi:hypothetical protein